MRDYLNTAALDQLSAELRPHAGRPVQREFYVALLYRYDELVSSGNRAPAVTIASEMEVPPGTVKSWLKRGRTYLDKQSKPIPIIRPHCRTCSCGAQMPSEAELHRQVRREM